MIFIWNNNKIYADWPKQKNILQLVTLAFCLFIH